MSLEPKAGDAQALCSVAVSWALRYFDEIRDLPVYPGLAAADLQRSIGEPLPIEPQSGREVFDEFVSRIVPGCRHNNHPRMFGYISSSASLMGAVADMAASTLNQNVTSWRSAPAATTVELTVVDWFKEILGCGASTAGLLTSGGSMANLCALAAAVRAKTGVDVNQEGVGALPRQPVIYTSRLGHFSIPKAAALLGLGRKTVNVVETMPDGTIDLSRLDGMIGRDAAEGRQPAVVVLNAGDVNTGAFDPIEPALEVCGRHGLWCHVDASYGGFAALAPGARPRFAGIDRVDSIALDPHKWLFVPLDAGCVLVKDAAALRRTFSQSAAYVDVIASPDMSEFAFWDYGPELSRRFRALKIWMLLKQVGARQLGQAIERNLQLAARLGALIEASDDFELLAPVGLSIVCFRYVPTIDTTRLKPRTTDDRLKPRTTEDLDELNKRILLAVQRAGVAYLSNAVIDGRFALRACLVNFRTDERDLEILLNEIRGQV